MPETASRSEPGAHEGHFPGKNKAKWNHDLGVLLPLTPMVTWHADICSPTASYSSSPTMAALTWRFTWQMFTCITFKTPVIYLDWKSSQKDSVFAPFRSRSVSSAANCSTQIKSQFGCKVIWKYLTGWRTWLSLSRGRWIKQAIDHLNVLAVLHIQRAGCPSPAQPEHKISKFVS